MTIAKVLLLYLIERGLTFIFPLYLIEIGSIFGGFFSLSVASPILSWPTHKFSIVYLDNCKSSSSVPNWDRQLFFVLKTLPWTSLRLVWLPYKLSSGYPKFYSLPQSLLQIGPTYCYCCDKVTYRAGDGQLKMAELWQF